MKNVLYIPLALLLLAACGDTKDQSVDDMISDANLETLRTRRSSISEQQRSLEADIAKLDSAIALLSDEENYPLVSTIEATVAPFNHFLELQGDVKTRQNVLVYPEMGGTLDRILVAEGQRVQKGQVLARIDDGGMSSQLGQLRTQAELAKTTFERQKRLWDQKIGSEIQYLQAKANYEAQKDAVTQAESQLGKSTIRAPFSGIVDDVIKDEGTVVAPGPGSEVFRIVNLSDMYIEVEVPERYVGSVTEGKEVKVFFPVLGDSITTRVRTTGNFINPNNRSFTVEIPVPNKQGKIKPNLTARVMINDYTNEEAILIPQSIISENAEGEQYTYLAADPENGNAIARRSIITTGLTQGNEVEILSGLKAGDRLIKEGARSVKDGQKVELLNQE
ncbi:efflux RND transporter periplasmic adaptor subunit [Zeaxanthinibacter sp. PT1]|uniref:efflux RND transporter periplasmic adaptor subunit n=1 Tax=Zeaxanthinibacter TaxID=561554 RepID=UPI002349D22F|nr:efflux RND transporter periplasmic adaptor subunit [Zeaxanthinibacter sp. PT1]MDC6350387.1 efflux RND transporter periplasmic adaptor subunit [Zeaxanthinibacter sp. PT1]